MPPAPDTDLEALLAVGEIDVVGRLADSSNGALLVQVATPGEPLLAIHKPTRLERPLWDYPTGTLTGRERAAYLVCRAGGFDVVPPTVLRDGPLGPGSVQLWVGDPSVVPEGVVDVVTPGEEPPGWITVLTGEGPGGEPLAVVHAPDSAVRTAAVYDALINNSDRKGGHLLRDGERVRGVDHGVSLGVEPKLRTVLWGWVRRPLPDADLERLETAREAILDGPVRAELDDLLTREEVEALLDRAETLLRTRRHPGPRPDWPAIPWPAM